MMTDIANETARGQLEETQHKIKFRHLWTHTMCQGKTSAGEKPTYNLASTVPVTQNNAYTPKQNSITTICARNLTQNEWCTNIYTNSKMSTPILQQQTTAVKSE